MKKILYACFAIAFLFTLSACGNQTSEPEEKTSESHPQEQPNSTIPKNGKSLVVYYSASGNTKAVATTIAEKVDADLFEIIPQEPYTNDDLNWRDETSRVSLEYADETKRDVPLTATSPDHWQEYDYVYIGYPIWWGIAAWPINRFIVENDFSDKTIIPFCTSSSSSLGNSDILLQNMNQTGTWWKGKRFSSNPSNDEITEWLQTILTTQQALLLL